MVLPLDVGSVASGKALDLRRGHRVHAPAGLHRTEAQGEGDDPARLEQGDELAKGSFPVGRGHVHPHRVDEDEIECETGSERLREFGQAIGENPGANVRMPPFRGGAHRRRRLDRDDLVAQRPEPCRVPAAPGAHVEGERGRLRQEVEQPLVDPLGRDGFVARRRLFGPCFVPAEPFRHAAMPPPRGSRKRMVGYSGPGSSSDQPSMRPR